MPHLRTQIRDVVVASLNGLASTASRVSAGRMYPADETQLPCLLVRVDGETVSPATVGTLQERELELVVAGFAMNKADVDAQLNQLAIEVETAMAAASPTLGGLIAGRELTGVQSGIDESMQKPAGRIELTYRITYFTQAGNPGVAA